MADYTLKITDGTTEVDLYGGANSIIAPGGLQMPIPLVTTRYIDALMQDTSYLASSYRKRRTITLKTRETASSLANLQTELRKINKLLQQAQIYQIQGIGSKVYLEFQFGDSAGASIYYDIFRGDLHLPSGWFDVLLQKHSTINDAQITIECEAVGRYTNTSSATSTRQNSQQHLKLEDYTIDQGGALEDCYDVNYIAQTFQASSNYTLTGLAMRFQITGTPTVVKIELWSTTGSPAEPNALLESKTFFSNRISELAGDMKWLIADGFSTAVTSGTDYAIVVYCTGNASDKLRGVYDTTGSYANGRHWTSGDSGGTWTGTAGWDFDFATFSALTDVNYYDITSPAGDLPAKLFFEVAPANDTGTKKLYIGKRSGDTEYNQQLWFSGERMHDDAQANTNYNSSTNGNALDATAGIENGSFWECRTGTTVNDTDDVCRWGQSLAAAYPKGRFRVLVRCKTRSASYFAKFGIGLGWLHGADVHEPATADFQKFAADETWYVKDLGVLDLPGSTESEIEPLGTPNVYIYIRMVGGSSLQNNFVCIDWVMMFPVGEGAAIIDSEVGGQSYAIDSISKPPGVFALIGDSTSGIPAHVGGPFHLGLENTRIYMLREDDCDVTFATDMIYQAQFLHM